MDYMENNNNNNSELARNYQHAGMRLARPDMACP